MVAGAERFPASSTAYTSIVFTMPRVSSNCDAIDADPFDRSVRFGSVSRRRTGDDSRHLLVKIRVRRAGSGRSNEIAPNGRYTRT